MQNDRSLEPPDRAAPGVNPGGPVDFHDGDPALHASGPMDPPGTSSRGWGPFARLLRAVRGDKYMADAYEPAWSSARRHESRPHSGVVGWRAHAATVRKRPVPATIEEHCAGGSLRRLPRASPRDGGPELTLLFTRHTRGTIEAERDRRLQRRAHATTAYPTRVTERAAGGPRSRIATAVADNAGAVTQARVDMDRWVDEGGMVPFEAAALLRTTASRR